jgi:dCTP deaminase
MAIKSDRWIRRMAVEGGMIDPFEPMQVREGEQGRVISYGTSSYGYDVRCADEFKIFTNINSAIVDPKNFDSNGFVDLKSDVCIIPPNSFALARTVEYLRIPRNVLTICLGKSTYARCFRGDTRVALLDGTTPTLEEMARRADDGELFWGYSIEPSGRVAAALLDAPRYVGRDALMELTLDNGAIIQCTPDHEFVMRDGRFLPAHRLRSNDSLMPLYRQLAGGYEFVYQPSGGDLYPTHRLADEWNVRNGIYRDVPGTHRYHRDLDRRNNLPWNIARVPASDRIRLHHSQDCDRALDPGEYGASIQAGLERMRGDPAWIAHSAEVRRDRADCVRHDDVYADARYRLRHNQFESRTEGRRNQSGDGVIRRCAKPQERLGTGETCCRDGARDRSTLHGRSQWLYNHRIATTSELPGDHDVYCLTVPEAGNFALASGVFTSNCGIIVNVTPLEPEWEGHVTLEFSNTTPLPAKIYANEGVAQILFFESDEVCETSYKDRGGKYQGQRGVTLPKS